MIKIKEIIFGKSLLLIDFQAKIQKEKKSNINPDNLNTLTDLTNITRNFLCENLFYVAQKILIELILKKVLFPLCDYFKNKYNKYVTELVNDDKIKKLIQETYKLKFEELKQKIIDKISDININQPAPIPPK